MLKTIRFIYICNLSNKLKWFFWSDQVSHALCKVICPPRLLIGLLDTHANFECMDMCLPFVMVGALSVGHKQGPHRLNSFLPLFLFNIWSLPQGTYLFPLSLTNHIPFPCEHWSVPLSSFSFVWDTDSQGARVFYLYKSFPSLHSPPFS